MASDELSALGKIADELEPLDPEARNRVISWVVSKYGLQKHVSTEGSPQAAHTTATSTSASKADKWLASAGISHDQLAQVFHLAEGSVDVIAHQLVGTSKKDQTIEAYLLCGAATFLATGSASFPDTAARDLCIKLGCYDKPHHSEYTKQFGNRLTGSKSTGWTLTTPGLAACAELIKSLSK